MNHCFLFIVLFLTATFSYAQSETAFKVDTTQIEPSNFSLLFYCRRATDNEIQKHFPEIWTYQKKQATQGERYMNAHWQRQRAIFISNEEELDAPKKLKKTELHSIQSKYFEPIYLQDRFQRVHRIASCEKNGDRFILLAGRVQVLLSLEENGLTVLEDKQALSNP